jgi:hypothetical protein
MNGNYEGGLGLTLKGSEAGGRTRGMNTKDKAGERIRWMNTKAGMS